MRWQYMFVEFNAVNDVARVYRINDKPLKEVEEKRPLRYDFCAQLGMDGWEMVNYAPTLDGNRGPQRSLIIFKRNYPQT